MAATRGAGVSIAILDGPAAGFKATARAAPTWLRVVINSTGNPDLLNEPTDYPSDDERVYGYRQVEGTWNQVFVRPGGRYESADYRHVPELDGLRSRERWVAAVCAHDGVD